MSDSNSPPASTATLTDASGAKVACADCGLYSLCLPVGVDRSELAEVDRIIKRRRPLQRGEVLFAAGSPFHSIYAVRSGSIKTFTFTEDGREQVTGFFLPGELVGLDAIGRGIHHTGARTLQTTSVCEIPYSDFESVSQHIPSLARQLLRIMSREMHDDQVLLMLLGKRSADERLAAFLLNLSERFGQRGYSPVEYNLSMSRHDIANYLGLAVETVSRWFSRLQDSGIIAVRARNVRLVDLERLRALAGG